MNDEELRQEYERRLPVFELMKNEIAKNLQQSIEHKKIHLDAVNGRVKAFDSFMKKTQNNNLQNPFLEINDIVGLRVICLYRDDIAKIKDLVRDTFDVISDDDKIESKDVDRFGYLSAHVIARLGTEQNSSSNLHNLPFEIQIRTIAQHAWASISHHLVYKKSDEMPKDQERDFQALSALFYVADSQFLWLRNEQNRRGPTQ